MFVILENYIETMTVFFVRANTSNVHVMRVARVVLYADEVLLISGLSLCSVHTIIIQIQAVLKPRLSY